ncbi:translation machinery associated tma7 protein, partial [Toxoplasma gondii FOU]
MTFVLTAGEKDYADARVTISVELRLLSSGKGFIRFLRGMSPARNEENEYSEMRTVHPVRLLPAYGLMAACNMRFFRKPEWPLFVFLNSFRPSFALLVFCSLSPFFFFRTCRKDADRKSRRQEKTSKAAEKSELRRRDRHGVQEEAEPTGSVSHTQLASSSLAAFNS